MTPEARERLERLLAGARRLADPNATDADTLRERLRVSTGLSRAGVDLALAHCLELDPSESELEALAASVEPTSRSHVLLSANVFVAAHRAIALALAASAEVCVRASRREPEMASFLARETPGLFQLLERLEPVAGEQVFAYGSATTLEELSRTLPEGVHLRGHGPGFGLVVCDEQSLESGERLERMANELAFDMVLFDQRGCLSPRLLLLQGSRVSAGRLAEAVADALGEWEKRVPLGSISSEQRAEATRYAATLSYSGELLSAGAGVVGIAPLESPLTLAPEGRNLHVLPVANAAARAQALAPQITTFAAVCSAPLRRALETALPHARPAVLGRMQCPAFDGSVDRRTPHALRSREIILTNTVR